MPHEKIVPDVSITSLAILDAEGKVDKDLEPDIDIQTLLKLYRFMVLARRFDERLVALQRQGRIGTFPPITGQEAAQLGAVAAIRPTDWLVPSFRETAAELWRGRGLDNIIIANNGLNEGGIMPDHSRDFPVSIPVASQIPHAVGLAWAARYRQSDEVVMVFFGDGATSEGDFHEAMNFAAVFQVPVIFVCQNNQWAISIPLSRQTRSETLAQKAVAYGMPGIQVDGNDILAVYAAAEEAVARARSGGGPTFIECVTYRVLMHTTADDPKRYRSDEAVDAWRRKDPLIRFETYLRAKGVLDEAKIAGLQSEIEGEIKAAVDHAEARMKTMGDPMEMFDHQYAAMPPTLRRQKAILERELAADGREVEHE
ncbi:3-methyl-2-oxobutanoate dehydrogenase subunit alpha [Desulfosarcina cetonica]|uniref:pyruvate dehydrogenase (acetyl-transferring) E1 component subunit alpha n=1 Tax=Desulfosarcina cetonica TaxID=90730 RepID=UPI0006D03145|nr:pyruvate dehydrogenase (acetyl-transferring) E1 component subunit alpha [Desulfosarcina cetonica]VTR68373.1 3-methyl-2-oxobutanoate dehydrogenase subunit alpha [Desulfosarcina cetonica]